MWLLDVFFAFSVIKFCSNLIVRIVFFFLVFLIFIINDWLIVQRPICAIIITLFSNIC